MHYCIAFLMQACIILVMPSPETPSRSAKCPACHDHPRARLHCETCCSYGRVRCAPCRECDLPIDGDHAELCDRCFEAVGDEIAAVYFGPSRPDTRLTAALLAALRAEVRS